MTDENDIAAAIKAVKHGKVKDEDFSPERLIAGLEEVRAFSRWRKGDESVDVSKMRVHSPVKKLRERLGLSQPRFCERFGIPLSQLRDWEQGRTSPDKTAWTLLRMIEKNPEAVAALVAA